MSDTTPRVALPLLAAAQSQKHVTHNEALLELDALVATVILDRDLSTPPSTPADGNTYLVKATGTAAWAGQDGKVAYAIDGGWRFYAPFEGLSAYVADETKLIFYNGSAWVDFVSAVPLENVPMLGVNAAADSSNKLTVASAAVLFNNIGAGVQAKLNKNASADTASLLYQTNFSGRAEIGLTGDDNFHFKVSPDGSTFYEALILNRNTGSQLLKHVDITSATTLGATHFGRLMRADASGGAFNVTLPATADVDDWIILRKKDSSANRVIVKDNAGNDVAWLSSQYDEAMFAFWDGAWTSVRWNIAPLNQAFTASGTYTRPPLAKSLDVLAIAGGNGGGSGRRGAAGSGRSGGSGGPGGSIALSTIQASLIGATETVAVGAGGAGGAAVTGDNTNGNNGSVGGDSTFGTTPFVQAKNPSSAIGSGGTLALTSGATNTAQSNYGLPGSGGGTVMGAASNPGGTGTSGGGGGGGSISVTDAAQSGGNGGIGSIEMKNAAGGKHGAPSSAGTSIADSNTYLGGGGGGGGDGCTSGAAAAGGAGGAPGGGGGGGGASVNGNASGAGGAGGRGEVRVTAYF
ncbi:MAG: DUF2793 domain-containing protein [Alphaproteobacteria bacterium]